VVPEWEYLKIDLNQHYPRGDELDLLNEAGADGWELVGINSTNIAYLKRSIGKSHLQEMPNGRTRGLPMSVAGDEQGNAPQEVAVKYRDSATEDRWTGHGRMARWLKLKQDAGEDIEKYRVSATFSQARCGQADAPHTQHNHRIATDDGYVATSVIYLGDALPAGAGICVIVQAGSTFIVPRDKSAEHQSVVPKPRVNSAGSPTAAGWDCELQIDR
jgi:H-NS histone family